MRRLLVAVSPLVLALPACKPEALPPPDAARSVGDAVPVTRLRAEPYSFTYSSGLEAPARRVIRDAESWREVWTAIWRRHSPELPLPAVDFASEMVIVAALGQRATGGYSIFIDSAEQTATGITVTIRSSSPGARCGVTGALSQPVDIARLPRTDGAVQFRERQETVDCP